MEPVLSKEITYIYGTPPVGLQQSKMLMLTEGKIAVLGTWRNCVGVIAWYPLPNRDKEEEKRRNL